MATGRTWQHVPDDDLVARRLRADARQLLAASGTPEEKCDGLVQSDDPGCLGAYQCRSTPAKEEQAWISVVTAVTSGADGRIDVALREHRTVRCRELRRDVTFIMYLLDGKARTFDEMDNDIRTRTDGTAEGSIATSLRNMSDWKRRARYEYTPNSLGSNGPFSFSARGQWRGWYLDKVASGRWKF